MKRALIFTLFLVLLVVPGVMAIDIGVNKTEISTTVVSELNNPALIDFVITNNGPTDQFRIYSLISVEFEPRERFELKSGETKTINAKIISSRELTSKTGYFSFEYQIKGDNTDIFKDSILLKIVNFNKLFEIETTNITLGSDEAVLVLRNLQNATLENVDLNFSSVFFESVQNVSVDPLEKTSIKMMIDKNRTSGLLAGKYPVRISVPGREGAESRVEGNVYYVEREEISTLEEHGGAIVRTISVTKKNEGNIPTVAQFEIRKNVITRLFTVHSDEPSIIDRKGLSIRYGWERVLAPGEEATISSTTNYTFPLIIVILIILVIVLARIYVRTAVVAHKSVSFVRTKGGEFALKVNLRIKARKHVEKIKIIDKLPGAMELYEKYGKMPDSFDRALKRLIWNIDHLNAGEERVLSYIMYSKLKVVGRFELPAFRVEFVRSGNMHTIFSNRAFFVSETAKIEEY